MVRALPPDSPLDAEGHLFELFRHVGTQRRCRTPPNDAGAIFVRLDYDGVNDRLGGVEFPNQILL